MTLSTTAPPSTGLRRSAPGLGRSVGAVGAAVTVTAALLLTPAGAAQATTAVPAAGSRTADTQAADVQVADVQAAAALPAGVPTVKNLGLTGSVRSMALAGGKVWVSSGNQVDVFTTAGQKLKTVTGLLGADELLPSSDGTSVYVAVAQDARIATLSAATMTPTATWPTSPCPSDLALAAGRLFYAYGCDALQGAISSVSLSDGSAGPVVADSLYYAPQIDGAGTSLVSAVQGLSPLTATSYTANPDGSAEVRASSTVSASGDFAVSPDGTAFIMRSSEGIARFATADLSVHGTFDTGGWSDAVAYAPDGTHLGAALSGYGDLVQVFDAGTAARSSRSAVATSGSSSNPTVVPGTLRFSTGGTLYAVAQPIGGGSASLVTATAKSVSRGSKPTATVTSPKSYGKKATVKVTSAPAKTRVTVNVTANGATTHVNKVTSAKGTVSIPLSVKYNGKVTVTAAGALRRAVATSTAKSFTVPAKLGFKLTGSYATRGSVQRFHRSSDVKAFIVASPDRGLTAKYQLQARLGGTWVTALTATYTSSGSNTDYLYVQDGRSGVKFRFVGSFTGDSYNAKAPKAYSTSFVID